MGLRVRSVPICVSHMTQNASFSTDKWFDGMSAEVAAVAMPLLQLHGVGKKDNSGEPAV